jgi:arsenate reductase
VKTVLFACLHNAGRSQIAAAFFNALADPAQSRALSAGTTPATRVHPEVVEVMREAGLELAGNQPRLLTPELAAEASLLVTMGCGEECPYVPVGGHGLAAEEFQGAPRNFFAQLFGITPLVQLRVVGLRFADGVCHFEHGRRRDVGVACLFGVGDRCFQRF